MRDGAISQKKAPFVVVRSGGDHNWLKQVGIALDRLLRRVFQLVLHPARRPVRKLFLCERLALGEQRFVAVVEFERRRFLLGGTGQSLVLLAKLDDEGQRIEEEQH
jgi:flagellar biogenesis protein FliO